MRLFSKSIYTLNIDVIKDNPDDEIVIKLYSLLHNRFYKTIKTKSDNIQIELNDDIATNVVATTTSGKEIGKSGTFIKLPGESGYDSVAFELPKRQSKLPNKTVANLDLYIMRCDGCGNYTYSDRDSKSVKLARESLHQCEICGDTVKLVKEKPKRKDTSIKKKKMAS